MRATVQPCESRRCRTIYVWMCVAIAVASPATAQIGSAALTGSVLDQARAVLPGATVTVTILATAVSRVAVTGAAGSFAFHGLPPGVYRVHVELAGFRPMTRDGVRLTTGEAVRLDVQLDLGGVSEALTVTADAPLLRSLTSALGPVVENRRMVDLPLNGRSFISLAGLAPGVALPPAPAAPFPR